MRKFITLDIIHVLFLVLIIISSSLNVIQYFYLNIIEENLETEASLETSEEAAEGRETKILQPNDSIMLLTVQPGDTLIKIFSDAGIDNTDAYTISSMISKIYEVSKLQIGHQIEIKFLIEPEKNHEYYSKVEYIKVTADDKRIEILFNPALNEYTASVVDIPLIQKEIFADATIDGSLYLSALKQGIHPTAVMEFIKLFSYDVDFQRDIHPGDLFEIYYDFHTNDKGEKIRDGNINYASITLSGKKREIYRFRQGDNPAEYYYASGENIRKTLLKTPINGARISSGFGVRKHPILGYSKMHKGLDYAAPKGTPVLAAGDGVVQYIKVVKHGYGKHIEIKHSSKYSTLYAHLDKFATSMKRGKRVSQGDVIGYVGATGLATGPHLHYEVHERGQQVNPTKISFAKFPALTGGNLQKLKNHIGSIEEKILKYKSEKKNGS